MGKVLPKVTGHNNEIALLVIQKMAVSLGKHPKLPEVLAEAVDRGVNQLDSYARYKQDVLKVEDCVGKNVKVKTELPEFQIMKDLLNVQMMLSFMMADMATILRGFTRAGSKVEYPLMLRRLTISRVSTLNHLISYRKDTSDSMWSGVMAMIPTDKHGLIDEAEELQRDLLGMRKAGDLDKRALYVHLIDNHKYHSNVPAIVNAMEDVNTITELKSSQGVLELCGKLSQFLGKLMTALSDKAKRAREESDRKFRKQMNDIRNLANHPNCPPEAKATIRKQMDDLEKVLSRY